MEIIPFHKCVCIDSGYKMDFFKSSIINCDAYMKQFEKYNLKNEINNSIELNKSNKYNFNLQGIVSNKSLNYINIWISQNKIKINNSIESERQYRIITFLFDKHDKTIDYIGDELKILDSIIICQFIFYLIYHWGPCCCAIKCNCDVTTDKETTPCGHHDLFSAEEHLMLHHFDLLVELLAFMDNPNEGIKELLIFEYIRTYDLDKIVSELKKIYYNYSNF